MSIRFSAPLIRTQLQNSPVMNGSPPPPVTSWGGSYVSIAAAANAQRTVGRGHDSYLSKLRSGVQTVVHTMDSFSASVLAEQRFIEEAAAEGGKSASQVVTEVTSTEELAKLEVWQQGDASMMTEEKLVQRRSLRFDRKVLQTLNTWWETAQRSVQERGGDPYADTIDQEAHATVFRRLYRVMLKEYDAVDAEATISEDWRRDAKGSSELTRKGFCDSFFELADTWTVGIDPCEYSAFLSLLITKVAHMHTCIHTYILHEVKNTHHTYARMHMHTCTHTRVPRWPTQSSRPTGARDTDGEMRTSVPSMRTRSMRRTSQGRYRVQGRRSRA